MNLTFTKTLRKTSNKRTLDKNIFSTRDITEH